MYFILRNHTLQIRQDIQSVSILRKLNGTRLADTLLTPRNTSSACSQLYFSIATVNPGQCGTLAGSRMAFGFIFIEITMPLHPGIDVSNVVVQPNFFFFFFTAFMAVAICKKRYCWYRRDMKNV